jgi:HD-GYP domain-containing protein (c-di-GMP phosphodiesterase class II)
MAYREVPVEDLRFGMFVAELDRPWTETPFVFQGFVLKSDAQINTIKKYCKKVFVDPDKAELPDGSRSAGGSTQQAQSADGIRGNVVYREMASVEAELPRARTAYAESTAFIDELSQAVRSGGAIDGERAQQAVTQITASIERNPDAMMLLVQIREKSAQTLSRAVQVSVYMTVFGRFLQLAHDRLQLLGTMGLLQDAGFLKLPAGMPEQRGLLSKAEQETFRSHITHSVEILSRTPGLPAELPGLASLHHERFDGSGYPRGLKGNAIPQVGAMAAIVDTFDQLTAPRPYGEQMSPSNALNVLYNNRGTVYHAALVEQFIQCIGVFPVGSVVELNSGEIGVVIAQNMVRRLQPRVMVVQDAKGNPIRPHKILDLVKEPKISPDEVYRIRRTLEHDKVKIDPRELFL